MNVRMASRLVVLSAITLTTAAAALGATLTVGQVTGACDGRSVTVPVTIEGASNVSAIDFRIAYDSGRTSFVSVSRGPLTDSFLIDRTDSGGTVRVVLAGASGISGSGVIANLVFQPFPTNTPGTLSLNISNILLNNVSSSGTPGSIALNCVPVRANVVLTVAPEPLLQASSTRFTVTNTGNASVDLTVTKMGDFFTFSPTSFPLGAGESRIIEVTGLSRPQGEYTGSILVSSPSAAYFAVSIRMNILGSPTGSITADPSTTRVDLSAAPGTNPSGTAEFTNRGTGTLSGVLGADVPWIIPQTGVITIGPGQSRTVTFTVDREKRPDADDLNGSTSGTLSLFYVSGSGTSSSRIRATQTSPVSRSSVKVTDTPVSAASPATIPPILPGEIAYYLPGAGHVQGGVGLFLSDFSLTNAGSALIPEGLRLLFLPNGSSSTGALLQRLKELKVDAPLSYKDVIKTVFQREQLGSLQVRASAATPVVLAATVFNVSNRLGYYGTQIPSFRSDRSIGRGERLVLTGLRKDATGYSNVYLQETSGSDAVAQIAYRDVNGVVLRTVDQPIGAFSLLQRGSDAPDGAVAAFITASTSSAGRIAAYATPVDARSGDTWSVADWGRQSGYAGTETLVIPVAGAAPGANNTFFRTDVSITNTGASTATGLLTYYPRDGAAVSRAITLNPSATRVESNLVADLFSVAGASLGWLRFEPQGGSFAVTSRTFNTASDGVATFGTGVPAVSVNAALRQGQSRKFGGLTDASLESVNAQRPGTFRTNAFLVEVTGRPVMVRISMRYTALGTAASQNVLGSREVTLAPYQLLNIQRITADLLGSSRDQNFRDMDNVQLAVEVIGGEGALVPALSMTENGTGDSILRIE